MFILLFRYVRKVRDKQLRKAADFASAKATQAKPALEKAVDVVGQKAKQTVPTSWK